MLCCCDFCNCRRDSGRGPITNISAAIISLAACKVNQIMSIGLTNGFIWFLRWGLCACVWCFCFNITLIPLIQRPRCTSLLPFVVLCSFMLAHGRHGAQIAPWMHFYSDPGINNQLNELLHQRAQTNQIVYKANVNSRWSYDSYICPVHIFPSIIDYK